MPPGKPTLTCTAGHEGHAYNFAVASAMTSVASGEGVAVTQPTRPQFCLKGWLRSFSQFFASFCPMSHPKSQAKVDVHSGAIRSCLQVCPCMRSCALQGRSPGRILIINLAKRYPLEREGVIKLTWLVLGGDPAVRSRRVEQFTAL